MVVEEKAQLELLQVFSGRGQAAHSHLLEVHLGQEAQLNHGVLACADGVASLFAQLAVEQEPRSAYSLTSVVQGWSLGRIEPRVVQVDGQASPELKGLAVSQAEQQLEPVAGVPEAAGGQQLANPAKLCSFLNTHHPIRT